MTVIFNKAKRADTNLLIGLAGASGSGKTFSAFTIAQGLAQGKPFAVIDTEAGRALHYADQFTFDHANLEPPFTPDAYSDAIQAADKAGYGTIVVDSASHEHAGEGGLLDAHDAELTRRAGDDWKKREALTMACWVAPKMAHKRMVSRLLQVRAHLILCFRAEEKIEIVREDGKTKIVPKRSLTGLDGWVPICEKTLPYELTVSLLLTPDAPGMPKPIKLQEQHRALIPLDRPLSAQTGEALAKWAAGESIGPDAKSVAALTKGLLDLASKLGKSDETAKAILASEASRTPGDHADWLQSQIARASEAVGKMEG